MSPPANRRLSISQRSGSIKPGNAISDSINLLSGNKKKARFKEDDHKIEDGFDPTVKYHYPFDVEKIYRSMENIVETKMGFMNEDEVKVFSSYDPNRCLKLSQILAAEIKDEIKSLDLQRYRIVVVVSLVQKQHQGINYKMKYCLDPVHDSFASYSYENSHFYIIATAALIYKD